MARRVVKPCGSFHAAGKLNVHISPPAFISSMTRPSVCTHHPNLMPVCQKKQKTVTNSFSPCLSCLICAFLDASFITEHLAGDSDRSAPATSPASGGPATLEGGAPHPNQNITARRSTHLHSPGNSVRLGTATARV